MTKKVFVESRYKNAVGTLKIGESKHFFFKQTSLLDNRHESEIVKHRKTGSFVCETTNENTLYI